ncbi:MAG: type II secretion system GspH family protein [Puniceicoccales bacterium]|jgi:prepilin-type N-terminal cleavage/methylation domain-containing protein|nr:type II secretion system GspH family protein [Puniceicoccales bacterium]
MNILSKQSRGLTMIEILIVLAILSGVLITLTKGIGTGREAALVQQTRLDMGGRIATALIAKVSKTGVMPTKGTDITAGFLGLTNMSDPFKEEYTFTVSGTEVDISPKKDGKADKAGVKAYKVELAPYLSL